MRDSQRQKVYWWERHWVGMHSNPLRWYEVNALVARVCNDYGLPRPILRKIGWATAGRTRTGLSLPFPGGWDAVVVLHELAHWRRPWESLGHCSVWMLYFIEMLNRYLGLNLEALLESAEIEGVDVTIVQS